MPPSANITSHRLPAHLLPYWDTVRNLPSSQIGRVFDSYLSITLQPVGDYTDCLRESAAEALVLVCHRRRQVTRERKADKDDNARMRDDTLRILFHTFSEPPEQTLASLASLLSLNLERNLLLDAVLAALAEDVPLRNGAEREPLQRHVALLLNDLLNFRTLILHRYRGLVERRGSTTAWIRRQKGVHVETPDSQQNHFLSALRALDKFDLRFGALTTHIARWLQDAGNSTFEANIGEAYKVTRGQRGKIARGETVGNLSVNLETSTEAHDVPIAVEEESNYARTVRTALAFARVNGTAPQMRLALLLVRAPYFLTEEELTLQRCAWSEQ